MPPEGRSPLSYIFTCHNCNRPRLVKRTAALPEDTLSPDYHFHCRDLGLDCSIRDPTPRNSFPRTYYPEEGESINPRPWHRSKRASIRLPLSEPASQQLPTTSASVEWGKQMKFWNGTVTYDGSPSLVELRGWYVSLKEAYESIHVPPGREQVLLAIKYLTGQVEK